MAPEDALQWDYDAALCQSGYATLEALEGVVRALGAGQFRGAVPMTRRLVEALPAMRRALLLASPPIWIHGDLHPGNVILRRGVAGLEPVLLDWARAPGVAPGRRECLGVVVGPLGAPSPTLP